MRSKRFLIPPLLLICMFLFSGCWNYVDIEDITMAAGLAIDKDLATGNYRLTIEVFDQRSSGMDAQTVSAAKSIVVEADGYTLLDAVRNAITKTGKKIFWGHCKVLIISQDIAAEGIIPVLDFVWRDPEFRRDIWMLISKDNTAGEILKANMESNEVISLYLDAALHSVDNISEYVADTMMTLIEKLTVKTTSVIAPTVYTTLYEGKRIPEINGSAVFKQDKLAYFIDEEESKVALLIRNELNGGVLNIEENASSAGMRISFKIYSSKVKLEPTLIDNKLIMQIDAKIQAGIAELEGSDNFLDEDKREVLTKEMENMLAAKITALMQKTQSNSSTDIFDFDGTVKRKMPNYWRRNKSDWDALYRNLEVHTHIKIDFILSSTTQKTIKIGD